LSFDSFVPFLNMDAQPKTQQKKTWLLKTDDEEKHVRILGGEISSKDETKEVKVVYNDTDLRQPRLVVRCPDEEFVGKHMDELSPIYLVFFQSVLLPAIVAVVRKLFGAKIVNSRSEGNVAVRPNSTEPITPHLHIVARGVVDVSDKFADPCPNNDDPLKNDKPLENDKWKFADPCFGNDYPLATGKLSLADSKFTKDDVEKMSHAFSQALIPEINVRLEKMAKNGIVLPITLNLKSY